MKRYSEKRPDGNVWKQVVFSNIDVCVSLEAWEYQYDEEVSLAPIGDVEFEGECVMEHNLDIFEALRKFVELIDKGWEVVNLTIRPEERQQDVNFLIEIRKWPTRGISVIISVNETKINKELAEKLRKIKEIIEDA